MSVDVIIPLYNNAKYIGAAIDSVLTQTFPVSRIIVVDDGSTDNGPEIVASYLDKRVVLIRNGHHERSATRNRAMREASADYVAFLDSDDVWHPQKIEKQLNLITHEVGAVYCGCWVIDSSGTVDPAAIITPPFLRGDIFNKLLEASYLSAGCSNLLIRRVTLLQAGEFDESLWWSEDWDLWLRVAKLCKFDYVDERLVYIRRHGGQTGFGKGFSQRLIRLRVNYQVHSRWPEAARLPGVLRRIGADFISIAFLLRKNPRRLSGMRIFACAQRKLHPDIYGAIRRMGPMFYVRGFLHVLYERRKRREEVRRAVAASKG